MVQKKYPKDRRGKVFRLEVQSVDPPAIEPTPPIINEELTISTVVLGTAAGQDVTFAVHEPHLIHEDPIFEATAQTAEETRVVETTWTCDWADHKENVSAARFVCVARCGDFVNISEPFEFKQKFTATLKDEQGNPLASRKVRLRPARGPTIQTQSDEEGKVEELVPPGKYRLEIVL